MLMDEYDAIFRTGARVIVLRSTGLHDIRSRRQRANIIIAEDVGPGSLDADAVIGPGVAVGPGCESRGQPQQHGIIIACRVSPKHRHFRRAIAEWHPIQVTGSDANITFSRVGR